MILLRHEGMVFSSSVTVMSVVVAARRRDTSNVCLQVRVLRNYLSPSTTVLESRLRCQAARQTPQPSLLLSIYLYIYVCEYGIGFETRKSHSDNTWLSTGTENQISGPTGQNREPEMNPYRYGLIIFDKLGENRQTIQKQHRQKVDMYLPKNELDP